MYDLKGKRVYVAGHRGMAGSALVRRLEREECDILTIPRQEIDLRDQRAVGEWMKQHRPHAIFLAAAKVGGILANNLLRADFIYDNLMIAANVIHAAHECGVEKLMFLGSTCIYPREAPQPMSEKVMLTGPLEPTNEPYAIAKIAGVKLAESYRLQYGCDFISVMPTNLYGSGDNYHPEHSHVMAALIRRFHEAKQANANSVSVWGSGTPRREFLYVDDLADACIFLMKNYSDTELVNIGVGEDMSIKELAMSIAKLVGFEGDIAFDASKPDGTPRKLVDVTKISALGWKASTPFTQGLEKAYADFRVRHSA